MPPANNSKPMVETEAELTMSIFRNVANGSDTVKHAFTEIQKDREMYGIGTEKEQLYTERIRAKLVKENLLPSVSLHYAQENYYGMSGSDFIDEQSLTAFRKSKYDKMTPVEKAMNHYLRDNLDQFDHTTPDNKNVVGKEDLNKRFKTVIEDKKEHCPSQSLDNASGSIGASGSVEATVEANQRAVSDSASECLSDEVWRTVYGEMGVQFKHRMIDPVVNAYDSYSQGVDEMRDARDAACDSFGDSVGNLMKELPEKTMKSLIFPLWPILE